MEIVHIQKPGKNSTAKSAAESQLLQQDTTQKLDDVSKLQVT